jgi:hypothetical protein
MTLRLALSGIDRSPGNLTLADARHVCRRLTRVVLAFVVVDSVPVMVSVYQPGGTSGFSEGSSQEWRLSVESSVCLRSDESSHLPSARLHNQTGDRSQRLRRSNDVVHQQDPFVV